MCTLYCSKLIAPNKCLISVNRLGLRFNPSTTSDTCRMNWNQVLYPTSVLDLIGGQMEPSTCSQDTKSETNICDFGVTYEFMCPQQTVFVSCTGRQHTSTPLYAAPVKLYFHQKSFAPNQCLNIPVKLKPISEGCVMYELIKALKQLIALDV